MTVNNETGVIQPLDRLVSTCSRTGAWSHSDAVQAFGHIPLEFQSLGLDLMSVSAHKIGGPVGVGALVVRRGITPCPIGLGGGQEGRIRSGTLPVAWRLIRCCRHQGCRGACGRVSPAHQPTR